MKKPDIDKIRTTPLGTERIRKKLGLEVDDVVTWCKQAVLNANSSSIVQEGKNWYIYGDWYVLTINKGSHTIITAHKR